MKILAARILRCLGFPGIHLGMIGVAVMTGLLSAQAAGLQSLQGHVPAAVAKLNLIPNGPYAGTNHMRLAIGLPVRDQPGLDQLLKGIYDPASTNYHRYLTPQEFAGRFGATPQDYEALSNFLTAHNLTATNTHPNRLLLDVEGSVADIESTFHLHMLEYNHPTEPRTFHAPDGDPKVDLAVPLLDVSGLDDYARPHPNYKIKPVSTQGNAVPLLGSGPSGNYLGKDFRAAYAPGVKLSGNGQIVGLLQFDGYLQTDIIAYDALAGQPNVPLSNVLLDGFNGAPTGNGGEVEVSLDIEMVSSMAPGLSGIIVYEAGPSGIPNDILSRMANDNIARQLSCSWGWSGGPQASTEQIFQQMAAQGQTFFTASGDSDAYAPGQLDAPTSHGSPASSPNITVVGATMLSTTGPVGSYTSETVWQTGDGTNGSSGGISSFYPIPIWQQGINMTASKGSTTQRNMPDVALTGDNVFVIADNGVNYPGVSGTSCAAPLWAGFTALINQQAKEYGKPPPGFLNPAIYALANTPNYTVCFHDITTGNNTNNVSTNLFFAVPGYDLCTGLGTPTGSNIINVLAPPESSPVLTVAGTLVVGGNGNGVIDYNECNTFFVVLTNGGSLGATAISAHLSTTTPGVGVANPGDSFPDIPVGGTGTNLTGFQISTAPDFVCGTPIFFTLVLQTAQGTFSIVFSVNTGTPGFPSRFDNNTPVTITATPAGASSIVNVGGIPSALAHVSVSAYITESSDADLTLQLIGPDGTTVTLAQNDGGTGANFGLDCTDADRTTFDDDASTPIGQGSAPFNGTFQPSSRLAAFSGKVGASVNGQWQLVAVDKFGADVGAIQCWSLFLTTAFCTDGGGQCPGVDLSLGMTASPNPVLLFSNLTYTLTVSNRGPQAATGVSLIQILPPSVTFVSAVSSQGNCAQSGGFVTGTLGTMDPGTTATINVVVIPNVPGTNFSTASVGAQQNQLNPGDNTASVAVLVSPPAADLGVTLQASPSPVLLNGLLTYTANVTNYGPFPATNVVVTNTLDPSVLLIQASASQGSASGISNLVIASLGTIPVGSNATVIIQVRPQVAQSINATSQVTSALPDPNAANNKSTVSTTVIPAADLVLTLTGPSAAISGSNVVYTLTVQNLGLSLATDVNFRDVISPTGPVIVKATSAQGTATMTSNSASCLVTNLGLGASASMTITVGTTNFIGSILNSASVTAAQADPNTNNNFATLVTVVANPMINVVAAGDLLQSGSFQPPNGMIEPGETVTLLLRLQNLGNIATGNNLTATLLSTGGVTPANGGQVQNYGTLTAAGGLAGKPFTFTATGTNGGTVVATLALQNNGTNLPSVSFTNLLPGFKSFANTINIVIPDHGEAGPYPSTNVVSGVTGILGRVTVTLTNLNHTYPDDIDMLLVGPVGQTVLLMSHCGGGGVLTNTSLTFDDGAINGDGSTNFLPTTSQITSGTYAPTINGTNDLQDKHSGADWAPFAYLQIGTNDLPATNTPPPFNGVSYYTNLAMFNGSNPNGNWRLYVFDRAVGDQGIIVGGWSLGITSGSEVNPVVDLAVTGSAAPSPVMQAGNLTYTFTITNNGPNPATSVQFTNILPANVTLVSATNSAKTVCATNGGMVVCSFPTLNVGSNITVTVVVTPLAGGTLTSEASVSSADADPLLSNNSVTITTTVNALVADLGVTLTGPTNATVGNTVVYTATITNNGPNLALGVVVTDLLQGDFSFVSGTSSGSQGNPSLAGSNAVCNLGTIAPGAGAVVTFSLASAQAATLTNVVTVSTGSTDNNLSNNSVSVVTAFSLPTPLIVAAGAKLLSPVPSGTITPGQTVNVSLLLANDGTADTTNLTATLQTNSTVAPSGLQAQNYGALFHGGPATAKTFTFTASGTNGGIVTATLQLSDGGASYPPVSFVFNVPATNTYANTNYIIIPDHGPGTPYPATIVIANAIGVVSQATATLNNFSHQFPNDVQVVLETPSGRSVVLMAGTGGGYSVTNLTLTFDDAASNSLPASSLFAFGTAQLVSGTFRPSNDGLALPFPSPAPSAPYAATLGALNGVDPNGTWTLFVFDNSPGDSGNIAGGWSLNLAIVNPVNLAADIGLSVVSPSGAIYPGQPFSITANVTNQGPAVANNVTVSNLLAPGLSFVSTSLGSYTTNANGALLFNAGSLGVGSTTNFTITLQAAAPGGYADPLTVSSDQTDVNLLDNSAQVGFQVQPLPTLSAKSVMTNGIFGLSLTLSGGSGTYNIQSSTNLNSTNWTYVTTIVLPGSFTDTNTAASPAKYYRAVLVGP